MAEAKFCESCGSPLHEGARFCGSCGAAVAADAPPPGPTAGEARAAAEPERGAAAPGRAGGRPPWLVPALAGGVLVAVLAVLVVLLVGDGDQQEARTPSVPRNAALLEPINTPVPGAFTESVGARPEAKVAVASLPETVPARASTGGEIPGDTVALYGGSGNQRVCDPDALVRFLEANPAKGRAWAGALGIASSGIRDYVATLTPVVLTRDTLVTNHGYANGRATPRLAVLQAGTAVLVDSEGVPRVKCGCGNPLVEPELRKPTRVVGTRWAEFSLSGVTVVVAGATVDGFTLVDPRTGELVFRPVGSSGAADTSPPAEDVCGVLPDDPSCAGAAEPEEAIGSYLADLGLDYLGDCSLGSADTDLGRWCSKLYEDRGSERVYLVGEYATGGGNGLLLALTENGWAVVDEVDIPNLEGV